MLNILSFFHLDRKRIAQAGVSTRMAEFITKEDVVALLEEPVWRSPTSPAENDIAKELPMSLLCPLESLLIALIMSPQERSARRDIGLNNYMYRSLALTPTVARWRPTLSLNIEGAYTYTVKSEQVDHIAALTEGKGFRFEKGEIEVAVQFAFRRAPRPAANLELDPCTPGGGDVPPEDSVLFNMPLMGHLPPLRFLISPTSIAPALVGSGCASEMTLFAALANLLQRNDGFQDAVSNSSWSPVALLGGANAIPPLRHLWSVFRPTANAAGELSKNWFDVPENRGKLRPVCHAGARGSLEALKFLVNVAMCTPLPTAEDIIPPVSIVRMSGHIDCAEFLEQAALEIDNRRR